jgi:hypothetical protein
MQCPTVTTGLFGVKAPNVLHLFTLLKALPLMLQGIRRLVSMAKPSFTGPTGKYGIVAVTAMILFLRKAK